MMLAVPCDVKSGRVSSLSSIRFLRNKFLHVYTVIYTITPATTTTTATEHEEWMMDALSFKLWPE